MLRLMRPTSAKRFIIGVLMGGAVVWIMTAAWIELAPASVLPLEFGIGHSSQSALDHCDFDDVLVLGDSKIMVALDRVSMSLSVQNFAQGGGNPAVDIYRTKSIVNCKKWPKVVVLSYSALNLRNFDPYLINNLLANRLIAQADFLDIADRLDAEDGGSSLITLSSDGQSSAVSAIGKLPVPIRILLYRADFPPLYWASVQTTIKVGAFSRWQANQWAGEEIIHPSGHDNWRSPPGQESQAIFRDAAINEVPRSRAIEGYYQMLVDRFAEHEIAVLIASIPVNEPTSRAISQPVKDEFSAFLHGLSGGHRNVTIIDPIWAVWPATSFGDRHGHVNGIGQAEITRLIDRCIGALLHPSANREAADCTMDHDAL